MENDIERKIEENGSLKHQQMYPCGCVVSYCLCGCKNPPEQRDCPTHAAALDLLAALIDVRDHVRDDSPDMWARVDAAIAKVQEVR